MKRFSVIYSAVFISILLIGCLRKDTSDFTSVESTAYYEETSVESTEGCTEGNTSAVVSSTEQVTTKPGLADMDVGDIEITTTAERVIDETAEIKSESDTETLTDEYVYEYETHYQAYTTDWNLATLYNGFELLVPVNYEYMYYMNGWDTYVNDSGSYLRTRYTEDEDSIHVSKLYDALEEDFVKTYNPYTTQTIEYHGNQVIVYVYKEQSMDLEMYATILPVDGGYVYVEYSTAYGTGINFMTLLGEMK
jgi:hypothetical protein